MEKQGDDISICVWLDYGRVLHPSRHHVALDLYRVHLIQPSVL